jgi:hypothetical protein
MLSYCFHSRSKEQRLELSFGLQHDASATGSAMDNAELGLSRTMNCGSNCGKLNNCWVEVN